MPPARFQGRLGMWTNCSATSPGVPSVHAMFSAALYSKLQILSSPCLPVGRHGHFFVCPYDSNSTCNDAF